MELYFRVLGDVSLSIGGISPYTPSKDLYHELGQHGYENIQLVFRGRPVPRSTKSLHHFGIREDTTLFIVKGRTGQDIVNARKTLIEDVIRRLGIKFIDLDNLTQEVGQLKEELVASQLFDEKQAVHVIKSAAERPGYIASILEGDVDVVIEKTPSPIYSSPVIMSGSRVRSSSPIRSSSSTTVTAGGRPERSSLSPSSSSRSRSPSRPPSYSSLASPSSPHQVTFTTPGGRLVTVEISHHMKHLSDLYAKLKDLGYAGYTLKWRDVKQLKDIDETTPIRDLDLTNSTLLLVSPMKHEFTTRAGIVEQIYNFKQEILHDEALVREAELRADELRTKIENIREGREVGDVAELSTQASYADNVATEIRARISASERGLANLMRIRGGQ